MGRLLNLGKKTINMKRNKIFIRVDSGIEIGAGHAMRCLSLAQALKKMNFELCFISKKITFKKIRRCATTTHGAVKANEFFAKILEKSSTRQEKLE